MDIYAGKVAIITGAASGIGRCLAERLAQRGAKVIMADVNSAMINKAAEAIRKTGGQARPFVVDVSKRDAVQKLVDVTVAEHGRLDYIFNNAGIGVGGEARDLSYEDWKDVIDTNLYGVINGVFAAYTVMVRQGFGHIVNTSSLAGLVPFSGEISYTASKYGILGLSHALRAEAADLGVRVSAVCPGKIETPIYETNKIVENFDREKALAMFPKGITPDKCAEIILKGVEKNKATIVVTFLAKFLWMLGRASSNLIIFLSRKHMRRMRTARIK